MGDWIRWLYQPSSSTDKMMQSISRLKQAHILVGIHIRTHYYKQLAHMEAFFSCLSDMHERQSLKEKPIVCVLFTDNDKLRTGVAQMSAMLPWPCIVPEGNIVHSIAGGFPMSDVQRAFADFFLLSQVHIGIVSGRSRFSLLAMMWGNLSTVDQDLNELQIGRYVMLPETQSWPNPEVGCPFMEGNATRTTFHFPPDVADDVVNKHHKIG
jgi:hypothetical protein